jgi:hypothetical protein
MRSFILSTTELTTKCLDELEFGVSTVPWCLLAASSRIFPGVLYMLKFLLSFDDDPHFIQCSAINMGQTSRLVSVGALVGALCTRFAFAGGSKFYWDGYLGSGYDVFVGNAKSTSGADPGYRSAVYNVTAATDNNMPYGIISDTCAQCTAAFSVTEHSGPLSYQTALQSTYSTSFKGWEASFTGSADFKDVYSQTLGNHDVVIETAAECCVYTAHFDTSIFPLFSSDFILMIKLMPTKYDDSTKAWFDIFIQVYGTHVVTKADFGGRSGQRSDMSGTSWSLLSTSNLVLQDTAKFSAIKATASAVLMSGNEAEQAQVFASYSRSQSHVIAYWKSDVLEEFWASMELDNTITEEKAAKFKQKTVDYMEKQLQQAESVFRSYLIRKMDFRRVPRIEFRPYFSLHETPSDVRADSMTQLLRQNALQPTYLHPRSVPDENSS